MPNNSSSKKPQSSKPRTQRSKDNPKKPGKKKTSVLVQEKVDYVDYKDVNLLQRFVSDRSKIRSRRVSGNRPSSSARSPPRSRTPARWRCCRTPSGSASDLATVASAEGPSRLAATAANAVEAATAGSSGRGDRGRRRRRGGLRPTQGDPPRRHRRVSASAATSATSRTATPATSCFPAAWPWSATGRGQPGRRHAPGTRPARRAGSRGCPGDRPCPRRPHHHHQRQGGHRRPAVRLGHRWPTSPTRSRRRPGSRSTGARCTAEPIKTLGTHTGGDQAAQRRGVPGHVEVVAK